MPPFPTRPSRKEFKSREEEFLSLACLTYDVDHPTRREKAQAMLAQSPELASASIFAAAALGDASLVRGWLARDAGLARERGGPWSWEPLLYLAYSRLTGPGVVEAARLLLQHGANPNAGFLWEENAPAFTVLSGLLGEGEAGPVNQPRQREEAALVRLMLDAGADANDAQGLYNRQFTRGIEHLEWLFEYGLGGASEGPWPERLGEKASSPEAMLLDQLFWAAEHGHPERIELFARRGRDLDATMRRKSAGEWREVTAYEAALLAGRLEEAALLLRLGARKVELSPAEALEAACARGDFDAASALLEEEPELVSRIEERGPRLLNDAAAAANLEVVRCLVALGVPVQPREEGAATALHQAAWFGHEAMVRLLLELGADRGAREAKYNATPADWALFNHHPAVAALLAE